MSDMQFDIMIDRASDVLPFLTQDKADELYGYINGGYYEEALIMIRAIERGITPQTELEGDESDYDWHRDFELTT